MDNRLALFDEGMVRSLNATGRMQTIQCVWVYERPIDMAGVRRFHRNFGYGMAGRRIERSPLPFGRYRWVATPGPRPRWRSTRHRSRARTSTTGSISGPRSTSTPRRPGLAYRRPAAGRRLDGGLRGGHALPG